MDHNEQRDNATKPWATELASRGGDLEPGERRLDEVVQPMIENPAFSDDPRLNAAIAGLVGTVMHGSASPAALNLCEQLNGLGHMPNWSEAARLGTELIDHPDKAAGVLHLANGDIVYPTSAGWAAIADARDGVVVTSGTMRRIHNPGVDPTARVHPTSVVDLTARVEAGAVIGPGVRIAAHAHIGRSSHISSLTRIEAGAYIGTGTTIRSAAHIGEGAIIGAGSDLGSCVHLGHGSAIAQGSALDSSQVLAAGSTVCPTAGTDRQRRRGTVAHISGAVERLLAMDHN